MQEKAEKGNNKHDYRQCEITIKRNVEYFKNGSLFTCAGKLPQIFGGFGKRINCPDIYEVWAKFDKYCNDNKYKVYEQAGILKSKMKEPFNMILSNLAELSLNIAKRAFSNEDFSKSKVISLNQDEITSLFKISEKMFDINITTAFYNHQKLQNNDVVQQIYTPS